MVFVSKCLWGVNCKYTGGNNLRENLKDLLKNEEVILICPECDGGLPTPRHAAEIEKGFDGKDVICGMAKVINCIGEDVTSQFVSGGKMALELALKYKPDKIYLKQGSPSCGCGIIYDGTFTGVKKEGVGVTCAALIENGFDVIAID